MGNHKKSAEYYANVRPEMLKFIPNSATKILEVGCGEGNFSAQLMKDGVEIWAIEPNPNSAKNAAQKLTKVIEGTIDEKIGEVPDNYFDVIIMNDVIEHLLEPWDDIQKLKSKLNDEGVFVSSIPNVRYAKNIFNMLLKKDWKYTEHGILDSTHFRFFTKKSIRRMFESCGYEVVKSSGINRTKSMLYAPFSIIFNIPLLFTQLDMFYMQFATVAKKKKD
ncbi:class I SAM-dependent methyltransferase [Pseudotenacibaculum haliotis]|uniref:Class I SAM-dependent methyltransferase n=1 Tax=Pseudotenacibaculum haliotis TaxID=1862138 RepID=A0ABW5LMA1_9FLAO